MSHVSKLGLIVISAALFAPAHSTSIAPFDDLEKAACAALLTEKFEASDASSLEVDQATGALATRLPELMEDMHELSKITDEILQHPKLVELFDDLNDANRRGRSEDIGLIKKQIEAKVRDLGPSAQPLVSRLFEERIESLALVYSGSDWTEVLANVYGSVSDAELTVYGKDRISFSFAANVAGVEKPIEFTYRYYPNLRAGQISRVNLRLSREERESELGQELLTLRSALQKKRKTEAELIKCVKRNAPKIEDYKISLLLHKRLHELGFHTNRSDLEFSCKEGESCPHVAR